MGNRDDHNLFSVAMSKGRHSYVKFYPTDWQAGTARMTRLQRSVYFDVCLYNWDRGEPMPVAEQELAFADLPDAKAIIETLVRTAKLTRTKGRALASDRAVIEATSSRHRWHMASTSGKAGAEKRWGNKDLDSDPNGGANGVAIANQNQNQNQIPPIPPNGGPSLFELEVEEEPVGFEQWWAEYPNKTGKQKAQQAFETALERLSGSRHSKVAQLILSLAAQKRVWNAKGVEGKYVPHPTTWLNQSRWTDDAVIAEASRKIAPRRDDDGPLTATAPRSSSKPKLAPVGWSPDTGDDDG